MQGFISFDETFKMLLGLLALVNPLGAIPIFIGMTAHQTLQERKKTIRVTSISTMLVIIVATVVGEAIIRFFGISISSLKVGGGLIVLLMALGMMNAQLAAGRATPEEGSEAELRPSVAVVPLAIPILTGPATISTVIIYAQKSVHWYDNIALAVCGVLIAGITWVAFSLANPISQALGRTGINIATRLMGLILAALAIEFITGGLSQLLPGLTR